MKYVKTDGPIAVISVLGPYDLVTSMAVSEELANVFSHGCTRVEVDFDNTSFIDSAAVGELVKIRRRVGPDNFRIKNFKGEVLQVLKGAKLLEWAK
ncbi:STAS domain-containing protein [Anaerospora hongkongensis]|uniref:STAS domain-containing protein n=1 Tax=Anaerospora hongkongensis TaxID=244830 RepID=UPI002FDA7247